MKKKLYVLSTAQGCLTNLQETTNVRKSLSAFGNSFESTNRPDDADVIVFNTCGYNDSAELESVRAIQKLKQKFPSKQFVVGGCLPKINPEKIKAIHADGPVVPSGDWNKLPAMIGAPETSIDSNACDATVIQIEDLETRLLPNRVGDLLSDTIFKIERFWGREFQPIHNVLNSLAFDSSTFVVSVGTGCLGHCTYCAIKNAKGRLKSRPLAIVLDDVKRGLDRGYTKFHFVGDDVGCWGQDIGLSSAILLKEVVKLKQKFELVVNYFDPTWLSKLYPELVEPMADSRIICVNFPLQSGSTSLVRKMGRFYDVETVMEQIASIKASNPSMVSKTHLMVGFPGETREDVKKTLQSVDHFDLIFPNRFAPRINTPAASNTNQISMAEKNYRFFRLKSRILARHSVVAAKSFLGAGSGGAGSGSDTKVAPRVEVH